MSKKFILASAGCLALSACETIGSPAHPLDDTSWRLVGVEMSGTSTQLTPQLASRHRLTFEQDGRVLMQLDCNRGNAR